MMICTIIINVFSVKRYFNVLWLELSKPGLCAPQSSCSLNILFSKLSICQDVFVASHRICDCSKRPEIKVHVMCCFNDLISFPPWSASVEKVSQPHNPPYQMYKIQVLLMLLVHRLFKQANHIFLVSQGDPIVLILYIQLPLDPGNSLCFQMQFSCTPAWHAVCVCDYVTNILFLISSVQSWL